MIVVPASVILFSFCCVAHFNCCNSNHQTKTFEKKECSKAPLGVGVLC